MKRLLALVLSLVMALSLAACQQSGDPNEGKDGPGSSGDSAVTGDTIRIGVSIARTGTAAEVGQNCYNSFMIALDEINAAGGINGKQVELVIEDSQNDATQAVEIAKKFIEDKSILCTVTGDSSTCNIACANYYEEAKMCLMAGCASNAALTPMGDYIFSVAGRSTDEIPFCIEGVLSGYFDVKKLAIIYANDDWGVGLNDSAQELCADAGIEIVGAETFKIGRAHV